MNKMVRWILLNSLFVILLIPICFLSYCIIPKKQKQIIEINYWEIPEIPDSTVPVKYAEKYAKTKGLK